MDSFTILYTENIGDHDEKGYQTTVTLGKLTAAWPFANIYLLYTYVSREGEEQIVTRVVLDEWSDSNAIRAAIKWFDTFAAKEPTP